MSSLLLVLISAFLDLAAVYFNVRMLLICFKDKTKYKFLQRGRILAFCQCACQVAILLMDAKEGWSGFYIQPSESCNVLRVLSLSVMFFQPCNLTAMMTIYCEGPEARGTRKLSSNLRVSAAITLGVVGSAMIWWHSCLSQTFLSQMALKVTSVVTVLFVGLQFASAVIGSNASEEQLEDTGPDSEPSMTETCVLPWNDLNAFKSKNKTLFVTTLMLACLVVILSDKPRRESLLYRQDWERRQTFLKEILYSVFTKFTVGIVLPVTLYHLINSSYVERKDKTTLLTAI